MPILDDDIRVLVIRDGPGNHCVPLKKYLNEGFVNPDIHHTTNLAGAIKHLMSGNPIDVILLDLPSTGKRDGKKELISEIVNSADSVPVIVLTDSSDKECQVILEYYDISDCLPIDELTPLLLKKSIAYSMEKKKLNRSVSDPGGPYKDFFEFNPLPMWVFDPQTLEFLDVNKAAVRHYGYTKEEFLNMTIRDIRPKEDINRLEKAVQRTYNREKFSCSRDNWRHTTKNGKEIHVEISANDIQFKGRPARVVLANDITEKIEANRALMLSEQRFKAMVQDGSDMIAILDPEGNYIYVSPSAERVLGISAADFIGTNVLEYIHPDDNKRIVELISSMPTDKRIHVHPFRFTDSEGRWRWIETTITNMMDDPAVGGLVANSRDITERIQKDRILQKTNERLRTAQNIAKLGHWTHDIKENKSDWSEQVYEIWEQDPDSFTPNFENLVETVHPEDREKFLLKPEEAFPGRDFYDYEHRIVTPDGKVKWILERITLHRNEQGAPHTMEGIVQDITERKMQEKALLASLKEKEILLGEIHHRVKNNLAVVSGMMQLQAFEEPNKEFSSKLLNSVGRIKTMANIHEQLYKSNSFSELEFTENLHKLVTDLLKVIQTSVDIDFKCNCEAVRLNVNQALPCSLIINEVVTNIIKHAFTERESGELFISLSSTGNKVTLVISDNGIGLPKDFGTNNSGTLGLHIIESLSRQLDAEYHYSTSDKGSDFTLEFDVHEVRGIGSAHVK